MKNAREKLAARFGDTQIGGKGKNYAPLVISDRARPFPITTIADSIFYLGTQRRKKKHVNVQNVNEDKKLKSAIKKFGTHITPLISRF